jgi:hypothetical protein
MAHRVAIDKMITMLYCQYEPGRKAERKQDMVEAQIQEGKLVITMQMNEPRLSASGKNLLVATSRGNVVTDATVNGKRVVVVVNAYIRP